MDDSQNRGEGIGPPEDSEKYKSLRSFLNKTSIFISESSKGIGKYVLGKFITSTIIGAISFIVFKLLEVRPAVVLSIILGIANLIPLFGPWVGLLICAVIVLFIEPVHALYTTITALLLQIADEFFLLPLIVGKSVDIKPILVFLVLFAGSLLFGFWGVLFAVPAAVVIKIGYDVFIRKQQK